MKPASYALLLICFLTLLFSVNVNATAPFNGAVQGNFNVNSLGTATYSIPIEVPPGINGLQPNLSLTYSSRAGNGLLGVGWQLSGLPSVTRCRKTLEHNGEISGVSFDSTDSFCLNGQQLFAVAGNYGAPGTEYRAEVETYTKVVSYGTNSLGGPNYFRAWTKNGVVMEFGNPPIYIRNQQTSALYSYTWPVSKISDSFGNEMTFSYTSNADDGYHYISQIDYAEGNASVVFNYQNRSDVVSRYNNGAKITTNALMDNIDIFSNGVLSKKYSLDYLLSNGSKRSLVNLIQECDGSTLVCKEPLSIQWDDSDTLLPTGKSALFKSGNWGSLSSYDKLRGDLNGDGMDDLVFMHSSCAYNLSAYSALSQGDGNFEYVGGRTLHNGCFGNDSDYRKSLGDFNGDGLIDLVWLRSDSTGVKAFVAKGRGDGTFDDATGGVVIPGNFGSPDAHVELVGDFNGDGLSDIVTMQSSCSYHLSALVALSNGDGTFENKGGGQLHNGCFGAYSDYKKTLGDFNGDGLIDLFWLRSDSTGVKAFVAKGRGDGTFDNATGGVVIPGNFGSPDAHVELVGDFNGDGLSDIVTMQSSCSYHLSALVALSRGDGTFENKGGGQLHNGCFGNYSDYQKMLGDINGDGVMDLIWVHASRTYGWKAYISLANRDGTFQNAYEEDLYAANMFAAQEYQKLVGDIDGDKRSDFILSYSGEDALRARSSITQKQNPLDSLLSISSGNESRVDVSYKSTSDHSVYTKYNDFNYPITELPSSMYVVSSYSKSNGIGGLNTYTYLYEGAKLNALGRGFLGFAKVTETDNQTNIKRSVHYNQQSVTGYHNPANDYWLTGLVDKRVTSLNGIEIDVVDNTWSMRLSDAGRPFPYKSSIRMTKREVSNGALESDVTVQNSNVTPFGLVQNALKTSHTFGTTESIVNTPCTDDTVNWQVGKSCLLSATKTSSTLTGGASARSETVKTKYTYSPEGKLSQKISFYESDVALTEDFQYDSYGNIWKHIVNGKDGTTTGSIASRTARNDYVYGLNEVTVTVTHEQDTRHTETWVYDRATGAKKSATDANGLTTTWQYDGFGRKIKEVRPDNTETNWDFYACDLPNSQRDPKCSTNESYYAQISNTANPTEIYYNDILNRTIRTEKTGPSGTAIYRDVEYNALGLITRESNNYSTTASYWTTNIYDEIGRIKKVLIPGNSNPATPDIEYTYSGFQDGKGIRSTSTTHRRGANSAVLTEIKYIDQSGNPLFVSDADFHSMQYTYTPFSFLETVTDPQLNVVSYAYDAAGNKVVDDDPDMGRWTYRYDALGLLQESVDSKGQRVTIDYDTLDRMTERTDHTTSSVSQWIYDTATGKGIGQLHQISRVSDNYLETHSYDDKGRLSQTSIRLDGTTYNVNNTYDAYSRLTDVTYPTAGSHGRFVVSNVYDAFGYLTNVRNSSGLNYWTRVSTNSDLQVTWAQLGNGLNQFNSYTPELGLPKTINTGLNSNVQNLEYGFDNLGNLEFKEDYNLRNIFGYPSGTSDGIRETFSYDNLNRLTNTSIEGIAAKEYRYDSIGNLTYSSDLGYYTYGQNGAGPHAVTYVGGASLTYDANGGMLQGRGRTISYSSFHKPVSISQDGTTSSFVYDPNRNRYKKTVSQSTDTSTTYYIGKLFEKTQSNGTTDFINYIYVGDKAVATHTVTESSGSNTVKSRYLHHDHQGTVSVITDESGAVKERFSYDAFGKRITTAEWNDGFIASLISTITTRGYTGHETLEEHQLIHMNGRVYDPELARFLSADPLVKYPESTQGWNRYSYVDNNPLSRIDPSGYGWVEIRGYVKVAVGLIFIAIDMACNCSGSTLTRIGLLLIADGGDDINGRRENSDNEEGFYAGTRADDQGNVTVSISYGQWNTGSPEQGLRYGIPLLGVTWNTNESYAVDTRPQTTSSNFAPALYAAIESSPYVIPILGQLARTIGTKFASMAGLGTGGAMVTKGLSQEGLAYQLKHLNKHLPGTTQSEKLIRKEGAAHVFSDKSTLSQVEKAIFERGQHTGNIRGADRYGVMFDKPIGYRISSDGSKVPLHYGEMKVKDGLYHIIPRTGPGK